MRLIKRTMMSSSINLDMTSELERIADQRHRTIMSNLNRLEEQIDGLRSSLQNHIGRGEYERDSRKRSEELSKIREQLAASNGLLRGVMTALGYVDPKK